MPPPQRRPQEKAAKKSALITTISITRRNDLRRAYEHMGRLEVLRTSLKFLYGRLRFRSHRASPATLYSATRSTGQIEENPVCYSITNIDGDDVSWRFVELGKLPIVMITSPSEELLLTKWSRTLQGSVTVRAKFWGETEAVKAKRA